MNNYSYLEIQNMQKRAMERVREMQRKSDEVLEDARVELGGSPPEKTFEKGRTEAIIKPKITNMPPNFPDFKEYFNLQNEPAVQQPKREEKSRPANTHGNILDMISAEPDRALLLGLLLLLKSEGADETLMMALMYIMA